MDAIGFVDSPNGTVDAVTRSFLGDAMDSGHFEALAPGLTDMYSTFYFTQPALQTAKAHHSLGGQVYIYSFGYEG